MLVKSRKAAGHIDDLDECFKVLRKYNMKLNPLKCSFGVSSGKFLGFIVNARGIEANPKKNPSPPGYELANKNQRGTKPNWSNCRT